MLYKNAKSNIIINSLDQNDVYWKNANVCSFLLGAMFNVCKGRYISYHFSNFHRTSERMIVQKGGGNLEKVLTQGWIGMGLLGVCAFS